MKGNSKLFPPGRFEKQGKKAGDAITEAISPSRPNNNEMNDEREAIGPFQSKNGVRCIRG